MLVAFVIINIPAKKINEAKDKINIQKEEIK